MLSSFYFLAACTNILTRNAGKYVSDTVQGTLSGTSHEANKEVAKDSDASLGDRASAAKDAVGDKVDQKGHDVRYISIPLANSSNDIIITGERKRQQRESQALDSLCTSTSDYHDHSMWMVRAGELSKWRGKAGYLVPVRHRAA